MNAEDRYALAQGIRFRARLAHWAYAVPCPRCRALFGQPCRSRKGRTMPGRAHEVRMWLALEEHEAGDE